MSRSGILTWLANVEGIVLPLYGDSSVLYQMNDGETYNSHCSHKKEDSLGISQCLPKLRPFPVIVRGDCLIIPHSVSCDFPLAWGEPPSIGIIVGHKIRQYKRKDKAKRAEEEEENFPCSY